MRIHVFVRTISSASFIISLFVLCEICMAGTLPCTAPVTINPDIIELLESPVDMYGIPSGVYTIDDCMRSLKSGVTENTKQFKDLKGRGLTLVVCSFGLVALGVPLLAFSEPGDSEAKGVAVIGLSLSPLFGIVGFLQMSKAKKLEIEADEYRDALIKSFRTRYQQ